LRALRLATLGLGLSLSWAAAWAEAPVLAERGMVVSREATASGVGVEVLRQGGNAVDAAVAVGFALAVTLPMAGNLGGGGFMLVHLGESGETIAIDYREAAPAEARREMFLDAAGALDKAKARFSHHAVGVPGSVAGLALALERYGSWSLARVLAPAIGLAEDGIVVQDPLAEALAGARERLARWPASRAVFLRADGSPFEACERLRQPDLAWSLRQIAGGGPGAFYRGEIAARLAAEMAAHGGPMTLADLERYRAVIREPVRGWYRGFEVVSMPPPSSGGVHLIQMLNVLERFPLGALGANSTAASHLMVEAMKPAYADRSRHLGDPDFWPVPVAWLVSKRYAARIAAAIDPARARPAAEILPGAPARGESGETTHFAVMDRHGNVVSNTTTLNFGFGTGIVAAGTGILLNNEMDDFSAKPGVPNAYGLVGEEANAIAGGKRPLSSMTPTIVFKDGRPWLATGSRGGSRIITSTLQVIVNAIDHGMDLGTATVAPRLHHQWLPDEVRVEPGFPEETVQRLKELGHQVTGTKDIGTTQSIMSLEAGFHGVSDPRRAGGLALGY